MEKPEVMMHTVTMRNGNTISVSDLIDNEAMRIELSNNAGTARVTTMIHISLQAGIHLANLITEHHQTNRTFSNFAEQLRLSRESLEHHDKLKNELTLAKGKISVLEGEKKALQNTFSSLSLELKRKHRKLEQEKLTIKRRLKSTVLTEK